VIGRLQGHDRFAKIPSSERLNWSVFLLFVPRCRQALVNRQNLTPAATAKTAQRTSIQRGWGITPPAVPSGIAWTAGAA
jgi:hypothetical protein